MSLVYEVTAQISEFEPGTGGFPLIGSGAVVNAFGEDRVVRVFSEDDTATVSAESGIRIYDPVRGEFVMPGNLVGVQESSATGPIYTFLSAEVAFGEAAPAQGERIAYELPVEGQPYLDIPETEGITEVETVAINLGIVSVSRTSMPPFTPGSEFPLGDLVGTFLGETGLGVSEERAQDIALLYETGLDRDGNIDLPGLNFWIDAAEAGFTDTEIAGFFTRAPEFEASFGPIDELTDAEYVDLLYQNTLEREGDAEGVMFWNDQLADGVGRDAVLFAFATSVENADTLQFVETLAEIGPSDWAFVG